MIHLLYHANCADGFASACIAHHALTAKNPAEEIRLQPINYGKALQAPTQNNLSAGDSIYYLDYTPSTETIQDLFDCYIGSLKITIIDHHGSRTQTHVDETASKTPRFSSVFDTTHSGAALTWRHFHPTDPLPRAVQLIEWRDLGHAFQDPGNKRSEPALELHAALMRAVPRTVEAWIPYLLESETYLFLLTTGTMLHMSDAPIIRGALENPRWITIDGYKIPAITGLAAELVSDACTALLKEFPKSPFAAYWYVNPTTGRITYGLRSRAPDHPDGHTNVAEIAARLDPPTAGHTGGGGHPTAAGFSSSAPIPFA